MNVANPSKVRRAEFSEDIIRQTVGGKLHFHIIVRETGLLFYIYNGSLKALIEAELGNWERFIILVLL